jgi:type II secretory pathway pseudopilin PulG
MRHHLIPRAGRRLWGPRADVSGVTLLESLISSAVVGIAAIGVLTMFTRGHAFLAGEGDNRVAVYLAQQKIELVRAQCLGRVNDPDCLALLTAATTNPDLFSRALATANSNAFYTRTTQVDCVDPDDYSSTVDCTTARAARRVTVTVSASPKEARKSTDPLPVRLRTVLASR